MARVLVTNGGPHSPEAYAMAAAEHLFQIDASVTGDRLLAAKRLQLAIAEALIPHHTAVRDAEVENLAEKGLDHLHCEHDHAETVDEAIASIVAAAAGTPWEAKLGSTETQAVYREEIAKIWRTAAEEEREWWARRRPDCQASQAFLERDRSLPIHLNGPAAQAA